MDRSKDQVEASETETLTQAVREQTTAIEAMCGAIHKLVDQNQTIIEMIAMGMDEEEPERRTPRTLDEIDDDEGTLS